MVTDKERDEMRRDYLRSLYVTQLPGRRATGSSRPDFARRNMH